MFGIQRTYVINLKRRSQKLAFCAGELAKLGINDFQLVEAIDAIELKLSSPNLAPSGAIGCCLSHRVALWDAVQRQLECVMIVEDDIILFKDWQNRLKNFEAFLPPDWQILWLGSRERNAKDKKSVNSFVNKAHDPVGSHCVIFRGKDVIKAAYESVTKLTHTDCEYAALGRNRPAYAPEQLIIDQMRHKSDIWPEAAGNHRKEWYGNL